MMKPTKLNCRFHTGKLSDTPRNRLVAPFSLATDLEIFLE